MITLLPYQIATLQGLQAAGTAAGNYSAAYAYLRDIAQMQGGPDSACASRGQVLQLSIPSIKLAQCLALYDSNLPVACIT
jgi:hypothetical protein